VTADLGTAERLAPVDVHLAGLAAALPPYRLAAERLERWGAKLACTLARGEVDRELREHEPRPGLADRRVLRHLRSLICEPCPVWDALPHDVDTEPEG
jgi:hypothetical protein